MEIVLSLATVLGALLIGVITPGPSFLLVARTSLAASRSDGIATAIGMGVGGVLFSTLVLFGLQTVISNVPWLYLILKVIGGLYLLLLAVRIWRGAKSPITFSAQDEMRRSLIHSFLVGLATQLSNPKTALIYGSIFAALLPRDLPTSAAIILPFLVFLVEAGWYALVALLLSSGSSRAAYLRIKLHVDHVASGLIGLLGLKLIIETPPTLPQ